MALSANSVRIWDLGDDNEFGVASSQTIYAGSAVGSNGGYARALNAGDKFLGFALGGVVGTGTNGGKTVRVRTRGQVQLSVGSLAVTDIGKAVYASDDGTFTLTATSNTFIGRVHRFISSGVGIVSFDCSLPSGGILTVLTDSSGGTPGDTIADVPGSYTEATLANQLSSLATKINAIIKFLNV